MVQQLFVQLTLEMSIVGMTAYIFSQTPIFRKLVSQKMGLLDKLIMVIFFSILSILGTYRGIPIHGALANTRAIGAIVAGLLGGPWVGLASGFIAGLHRYILGLNNPDLYFTALACGISTTMEGLFGGIIHRVYKNAKYDAAFGFITGILGETMQMAIILLIARPLPRAWELVQVIALPMIFANAVGIAIFMNIVKNIRMEQERVGAIQAQKAMQIANQTLPYLREGLNFNSAMKTIEIIFRNADVDGICITDRQVVLANIGSIWNQSLVGKPISSESTKRVIKTGEPVILYECDDYKNLNDKISSAVVVPLKVKNEVLGTLKMFQGKGKEMGPMIQELALGIGQLLSTQLELGRLQEQADLATKAELRALQAQINPHFLFNSLNTIAAFCRTDSAKARQLIIELAGLFRKTLKRENDFIPLEEEMELVNSYLSLEKARFGEKIRVITDIKKDCNECLVPGLILQPLVENSVKHGITPKVTGGEIKIKVKMVDQNLRFVIRDSGVGIKGNPKRLLSSGWSSGMGIGLSNVNKRLQNIYGKDAGIKMKSIPGKGTVVSFKIPVITEGSEIDAAV